MRSCNFRDKKLGSSKNLQNVVIFCVDKKDE